jgi:plastocyanin
MRTAIWRHTKVVAAGAMLAFVLPAMAACSSGSSSSGTSGGGAAAATTGAAAAGGGGGTSVNMTEVLGPPDKYAFTPAAATISSGSTINVTNKTDENHSVTCTPDGGAASVTINKADSGSLSFSKAGTYVCASKEHPEAKLTVTVQ